MDEKANIILFNLQSLEEDWFSFVRNNKRLRELFIAESSLDIEIRKSIPLDVQLWSLKYTALFNMVEMLKNLKGAVSEEIYSRALNIGYDFWLEVKDHNPEKLSIFQN